MPSHRRGFAAASRLTPYLTPYRAVTPSFRRTCPSCKCLTLNTGRPFTDTAERTEDGLENRKGPQVGRRNVARPRSVSLRVHGRAESGASLSSTVTSSLGSSYGSCSRLSGGPVIGRLAPLRGHAPSWRFFWRLTLACEIRRARRQVRVSWWVGSSRALLSGPPAGVQYAAGTVTVLEGVVTWRTVGPGTSAAVFPRIVEAQQTVTTNASYQFNLAPG